MLEPAGFSLAWILVEAQLRFSFRQLLFGLDSLKTHGIYWTSLKLKIQFVNTDLIDFKMIDSAWLDFDRPFLLNFPYINGYFDMMRRLLHFLLEMGSTYVFRMFNVPRLSKVCFCISLLPVIRHGLPHVIIKWIDWLCTKCLELGDLKCDITYIKCQIK